MSSQRVAAIIEEALALPEADRAAFLDRTCDGDAELRVRVEGMLEGLDDRTLVGGPAKVASPDERPVPPSAAPARRRIANYEIERIIGEGGMGLVYLAQQASPRRPVALKLIRQGMLTPKLLQRFEHESQILGRLHHPSIAQIYEAGAAEIDGVRTPFFAMEFVEGHALDEYIRDREPSERARLELFIEVCRAVQYAHQKGVVHRDLKPSNILVDEHGRPRVLDFGVARVTDADLQTVTLQTDAGQLIGTVPYMSPEQIGGDTEAVDTRSDVYTLGVILYQVLAGRLPYPIERARLPEAARLICEEAPAALPRDRTGVDTDLQTIARRALEKEPDRRYQSAAELADDIERYLNGEPILARAPSATYQLRKFARRNRGVVGLAGALVLIVIAGVALVSWQAVAATAGRRLARIEAQRSQEVSQFLADMLKSVDPELALGRDVTVREVLDSTALTLNDTLKGQPEVRDTLRQTISASYRAIGSLDEAYEIAAENVDSLTLRKGANDPDTLEARRLLAYIQADRGRLADAETIVTDVLTRLRSAHPETHIDVASARNDLARIYTETGRMEEAIAIWSETIPILREHHGVEHVDTLTAMHNLGTALKDLGRFDEAERQIRRSLDLRRRVFGPKHPQTAYSMNALATMLQRLGKNEESLEIFREVLQIRREAMGPEHPTTLNAMSNLAVTYVALGDLDAAEPLMTAVLAGYRSSFGESDSRTLNALGNLGYLYEDLGRLDEAEAAYRQVVETHRRTERMSDPESWTALNNLAMLLVNRDKHAEADGLFEELLALCRERLPADHYYTAIFETNHALALTQLGRFDEAESLLAHAWPVLRDTLGPDHPRTVRAIERAIELHALSGDTESASAWRGRLGPEQDSSADAGD